MWDYLKLAGLGLVAVCAAIAANYAHDLAYQVNAITVMLAAGIAFLFVVRTAGDPKPNLQHEYFDSVVRAGAIATAFWGAVGFLVGVVIALQLAFPQLNFEFLQGYGNFGRLRPLHTSAVIFAFGGNALIMSSFYIVQRTSAARLFGGSLGWFVFWGWQLVIVLAATGYVLGATQGKEYAEPVWYVDILITAVWVAFLIAFMGTLFKRKEPHIYVANWFLLSMILTVAMLHLVNNAAIPVSIFGSAQVQLYSGVQDAMVQWWYGHNAVGFFLTAGFLGMMYYFVPKQAERPVFSYKLSIIHFWALIFLYIWAGPHHLHYTALPDWASTLGMVFSVILWMPSWGGMINGLMTLSGAWDKLRTDPIIRMMVVSIGFYGMSTFEGPMMSIKAVNSLSHYTALPDWASTLGMVFSVILWMPSWGGMINGLMTLSGAWDKLRTDPIIRMMVVSIGFYGMSTFEGPMMSIKAVNSLSHYTDWTIGHVHSGALGWNGMITFGVLYYLVPRLWNREGLYSLKLVSWHFWLATIGIVLYASAMWVTGIMEGLMWREVDANGFLVNAFADTVAAKFPMYVVRAAGGGLFLTGALIMCWNLWMTVRAQPARATQNSAVPAE